MTRSNFYVAGLVILLLAIAGNTSRSAVKGQ